MKPWSSVLLLLVCGRAALAQGLPDLRLDTDLLGSSVKYDVQLFDADACELQAADLCVRAPGVRKLLRFSVLAVNQGPVDLEVGTPDPNVLLADGTPEWVYSTCHKHFHFQTFARYELRTRGGSTALLLGQKRSFCIEDTQKVISGAAEQPRFGCDPNGLNTQGVQAGWGDLYPSSLPCQWIDITDLAETGDFDLCVSVNTAGILPDGDHANDQACVPIVIGGSSPDTIAPKLKILAPRGHRKVRVGKRMKVTWRKRVKDTLRFVEILFSRDGGQTWEFIGATQASQHNTFLWTIPADAVTDTARVRVALWTRGNGIDADAGNFLRTTRDSSTFRIVL